MITQVAQVEIPTVNIVRSERALDLIKKAYREDESGDLKLTSYKLRLAQHGMVKALADQTGESQASIMRAILDEWCEFKLRGCD